MRTESAGQRAAAGVFQDISCVQPGGADRVGCRDPKVGGPVVEDGRIVEGRLELSHGTRRRALDDPPRAVENEAVDRVTAPVGRVEPVGLAFPVQGRAGDSTGKGKQERNAAARRSFVSLFEIRFRPQCVDLAARMAERKLVAVESQAGKNLRFRAGVRVTQRKDIHGYPSLKWSIKGVRSL